MQKKGVWGCFSLLGRNTATPRMDGGEDGFAQSIYEDVLIYEDMPEEDVFEPTVPPVASEPSVAAGRDFPTRVDASNFPASATGSFPFGPIVSVSADICERNSGLSGSRLPKRSAMMPPTK